jgi:hypothetical protein
MPEALNVCSKSCFFLARCWFRALLAEKGWRRSLPDLIYSIQRNLADH